MLVRATKVRKGLVSIFRLGGLLLEVNFELDASLSFKGLKQLKTNCWISQVMQKLWSSFCSFVYELIFQGLSLFYFHLAVLQH